MKESIERLVEPHSEFIDTGHKGSVQNQLHFYMVEIVTNEISLYLPWHKGMKYLRGKIFKICA